MMPTLTDPLSTGNGLVVCVLVKHRRQTNLTDICLFNLALSDLLFALTLPLFTHHAVVGQWSFGDFLCRFSGITHTTGFFSSIFFIVVMTLDRYVAILHSVTGAWYRTRMTGIIMTLSVWILSFSISFPDLIFSKVTNESYGLACRYLPGNDNWNLYKLFSTNILGLVIPLLVMVVCYSRIIPKLVGMKSAKRHRVVKLIMTIMVTFFLFWTPYNIYLLLDYLSVKGILQGEGCGLDASLQLADIVTVCIAYTHCCLNPIIYAFMGQKFAKRALQLLKSWVPSRLLTPSRHLSESSSRRSSVMSRSSEAMSTFIN